MNKLKHLKQAKCECGSAVAEGSVFCISCRAVIKRKNSKIIEKSKVICIKA